MMRVSLAAAGLGVAAAVDVSNGAQAASQAEFGEALVGKHDPEYAVMADGPVTVSIKTWSGEQESNAATAGAQFDQGHASKTLAAGVSKLERSDDRGSNLERSDDEGSSLERSDEDSELEPSDRGSPKSDDLISVSLQPASGQATGAQVGQVSAPVLVLQRPRTPVDELLAAKVLKKVLLDASNGDVLDWTDTRPGVSLLLRILEVGKEVIISDWPKPVRTKSLGTALKNVKVSSSENAAKEKVSTLLKDMDMQDMDLDGKKELFAMLKLAHSGVELLEKEGAQVLKDEHQEQGPAVDALRDQYRAATEYGAMAIAHAIRGKSPEQIRAFLDTREGARRSTV